MIAIGTQRSFQRRPSRSQPAGRAVPTPLAKLVLCFSVTICLLLVLLLLFLLLVCIISCITSLTTIISTIILGQAQE